MIAECTACEWRGVPTTYGGQRIPGTGHRYGEGWPMVFAVRDSTVDMKCPRSSCRAPIQIVSEGVPSPAANPNHDEEVTDGNT